MNKIEIQKTQKLLKYITKEISDYFQYQFLEYIKKTLPKDISTLTPFFNDCLETSKLKLELELQSDNRFNSIAKNNIQKIIDLVYNHYSNLTSKIKCKTKIK